MRRCLGELARESMSSKCSVGVTFEPGCAHTICTERDDERQVLDCDPEANVVRLARSMDANRLACRRERAGMIVRRDEIAREVLKRIGEQVRIGTGGLRSF